MLEWVRTTDDQEREVVLGFGVEEFGLEPARNGVGVTVGLCFDEVDQPPLAVEERTVSSIDETVGEGQYQVAGLQADGLLGIDRCRSSEKRLTDRSDRSRRHVGAENGLGMSGIGDRHGRPVSSKMQTDAGDESA